MKKRLEHNVKAERRDIRKRPKMRKHGLNLKRPSKFAGFGIAKIKK